MKCVLDCNYPREDGPAQTRSEKVGECGEAGIVGTAFTPGKAPESGGYIRRRYAGSTQGDRMGRLRKLSATGSSRIRSRSGSHWMDRPSRSTIFPRWARVAVL